jgi:hypothetical protein
VLEGRERSRPPHRNDTPPDDREQDHHEEEDREEVAEIDAARIRRGAAGPGTHRATLGARMDGILDWYLLGVVVGLGVTAGAAAAGVLRVPLYTVPALAALAGAVVVTAVALPWWPLGAVAAASFIGWAAFRRLSLGALPAALLGSALLAVLPVVGYLLAAAAPFAGARLGRRASSRFAGLRVLARD